MGRTIKIQPTEETVNYYGLLQLGYEDALPPSGDYRRDQLAVEALAFRISHDPHEGGLGRFRHCRNIVDLLYNHPASGSYKRFLWHEWSEAAIKEFCENFEVGLAGSTSSGKTNPAGLWAVLNFVVDPTHTKVFCLSTTLKEAKDRIWKEVVEYYEAIPDGPGKLLKSTNQIQGPSLAGKGHGTTSGIYLIAADRTNEVEAVNSLIGSKVTKTGTPTTDPWEVLAKPEFSDLTNLNLDQERLLDLVMRLSEVSDDRQGRIIIIVDEATGISDRILQAYFTNMKPGNPGRVQMIVIGNPVSRLDVHGVFCEPAAGWDSVNQGMGRWNTVTGGVCLHFHGERNPRITSGDARLTWMPSEKENAAIEHKYGRESLEYYRMVVGFWPPENLLHTVYTEADFIRSNALRPEHPTNDPGDPSKVVWGVTPPKILSGFDPSYSSGGDRAIVRFGKLGVDYNGIQQLEVTESVTLKIDISNADVPIAEQLLLRWKHECEKRHVPPEQACFDSSGGGISFAAIVSRLWSPKVRAVTSGGKPTTTVLVPHEKLADGSLMRACDKFANRASELWCAGLPFLRTSQIKGIPRPLAREICTRQQVVKKVFHTNKMQIEPKKIYKQRERSSPDDSDAFFLLLNEAMTRHGFKARGPEDQAKPAPAARRASRDPLSPWNQLRAKAARIANRKPLKRQ